MRKIFKKTVAYVATAAMAVTLASGFAAPETVKADDAMKADLENFTISGVEFEPIVESYESNDRGILTDNTIKAHDADEDGVNDGFTADIGWGTGWQRLWKGQNQPSDAWAIKGGWCDNPNQIRTESTLKVSKKSTYQISFVLKNNMHDANGNSVEKNVTITVNSGIEGDNDNVMLNKTVRVPSNGILRVNEKFNIDDYGLDTVKMTISFGAYAYSYEAQNDFPYYKLVPTTVLQKYMFAPGTTEPAGAKGTLEFDNFKINKVAYEAPKAPTTPTTPSVSEPSKAKISSAKNVKGKKATVKWKKVSTATKYQVKAVLGKKATTKTTTKTTYTFKKLKKGKTYKVYVRAYNKAGYGAWSTAKKVKITK